MVMNGLNLLHLMGLTTGLGRFPGGGNGNPLQYACLPGKYHGKRSLAGYNPWSQKRILSNLVTKQV